MPDILRLVGLSTKLHNYPDELSGGEQQRVSIARAFVNHPPLLLADEPTGNLDPETSIGIMQLIYRINRAGTTVVVATHDSQMVDKMRRRVVELREGRIIRDELSGLYRPGRVHHRVRGAPARRAGPRSRGAPELSRALQLLPQGGAPRPAPQLGARARGAPHRAAHRARARACSSRSCRPPPARPTRCAAEWWRTSTSRSPPLRPQQDELRRAARGHRRREVGGVHLEGRGARARAGEEPEGLQRRAPSCSAPTRCRPRSA